MSDEPFPVTVDAPCSRAGDLTGTGTLKPAVHLQVLVSPVEGLRASFDYGSFLLSALPAAIAYAVDGTPAVVGFPDAWEYVRGGDAVRSDRSVHDALLVEPVYGTDEENGEATSETTGETTGKTTGEVTDDEHGEDDDEHGEPTGVALNVAEITEAPYSGPANEHEYDTALPDGPLVVDAGGLVGQLLGFGERYRSLQRALDHRELDSTERALSVLRELDAHNESEGTLAGFGFDTTFERYERLFHPEGRDEFAAVERDWLVWRFLEDDRLEPFLAEWLPERPAETADRCYYSLLVGDYELDRDGALAERTFDVLERRPDDAAVPSLLLFLWGNDRDGEVRALSVLGELLARRDAIDAAEYDREHVVREVCKRYRRSDDAAVRAAAVEAVAGLDAEEPHEAAEASREVVEDAREVDEEAREVVEDALDDADPAVRATARRALDRSRDA